MNDIYQVRRKSLFDAKDDNSRWKLWSASLSLNGLSLKDTLISENMDYLSLSESQVLDSWGKKGSEKIKEKWIKENPKTSDELQSYYNNLDLYIPELSSWHAMEKNEDFMQIIDFIIFCAHQGFTSYLDFGAGIGSCGIFFNYYGFHVTLADISDSMLEYEQWRLNRHGVNAKIIDLKLQTIPNESADCATCIEVLEHTSDPVVQMSKIWQALKPNGYVLITTPFFKDVERPQHIIHDMSITEEFNKLGFKNYYVSKNQIYRVLQKVK